MTRGVHHCTHLSVGDFTSGRWGESVVSTVGDSTSGQSRSESFVNGDSSDASLEFVVDDSLSLEGGRGIERQLRVQICSLLCSLVRAASLYVMGNLDILNKTGTAVNKVKSLLKS